MRGHALPQLRSLRRAADRGPRTLPRQRGAPRIQEERGGAPASCCQGGTSAHAIRVQRVDCVGADRHDPFLAALAEQAHDGHVSIQIKIVGAERHGFGDARSRRVEKLEEGGVAQADRRVVGVGGVQESPHLVDGQGLGEVAPLTRGMQLRSGISSDRPLGQRVLVEPSDSRRRARHRRGCRLSSRDLPRCQAHRVILDVRSTHVFDVDLASALHVKRVAGDVAPIVRNCMRRRPFFDAQIVHPVADESFEGCHGDRVSDYATYVRERYRHAHIFARL